MAMRGGRGAEVAEFSAADAAFSGFRIVWERPVSVIYWAALQFAVSMGVTLFITFTAGPAFTRALEAMLQLGADPAQKMAVMEQVAPTSIAVMLLSLVLLAVLSAAINRAVLRPEHWRFGYLRLASDELRQLGLFAMLLGMAFCAYVVLAVAVVAVFELLSVVLGDAAIGLGAVLLVGLTVGGLVFAGVRLSLASPRTFDTGRIDLVGAWRMTRGRFWPLLGTYLLALGLSLVVQALTLAIAIFAVAIVGGGFGALGAQAQADFSSLAAALAPVALVNLAVSSIGQALSFPITAAPPAAIYKVLSGGAARGVGKTFD
jgi:hypothetical protein